MVDAPPFRPAGIIDMHTHAGMPRRNAPVDRAVLDSMGPGGVAACVVAAVADAPVIRRDLATRAIKQVRAPEPGECLAATEATLDAYAASGFHIAREPGDIGLDTPAMVLAIEGCDFLEGRLDRLDTMAARGVRSVQLTHYVVNETGDIQTAPPVHGGLTAFGAEAVRRMDRLGIIVDVAHCTEATVRGVAAASSRPFLCTHANLAWPDRPDGGHKRFISLDYARLVAASGGVVGAWIAVLWQERMAGMITHLFRLIDAIGIDHVGIGTDMPAGVAEHEMPDFSRHREIGDALTARGMTAEEVAKVCAGNWLRVFRAVRAGAA
ncbi:dipeptidase [Limobrevibacterium gyesilva]|uniref:Dipeptidase n=1 Tax=Limobrevibacterium gyesilva TaxID=2991712 RepID=A0AA41YPX4_9PROT|nr:dipeptidase [Limobrevibacterium gyesilva]MCW3474458.1 dipeptidase [Limobrevibacterium gyesilva]